MNYKLIKHRNLSNKLCNTFNDLDKCTVSKASTEIMLDRFYNGEVVEFPFSD